MYFTVIKYVLLPFKVLAQLIGYIALVTHKIFTTSNDQPNTSVIANALKTLIPYLEVSQQDTGHVCTHRRYTIMLHAPTDRHKVIHYILHWSAPERHTRCRR